MNKLGKKLLRRDYVYWKNGNNLSIPFRRSFPSPRYKYVDIIDIHRTVDSKLEHLSIDTLSYSPSHKVSILSIRYVIL